MTTIDFRSKLVPMFLAFLRIVIGWHFLYEGLIKILDPGWTARPFLEGSRWIFGDLFRWMASSDTGMLLIDNANAYGLALIGIALIAGLLTRYASWAGIGMLLMYYLAYPPIAGYSYGAVSEGNYLIVNKNLVEIFALLVIVFTRSGNFFGIDGLKSRKFRNASTEELNSINTVAISDSNRRRDLIKGLAGLPFLAGFAGAFLADHPEKEPDTISGATIKLDYKQLNDLNGKLPQGKLGSLGISRLIMGSNLISGWAHARDLLYANSLFKAYNTDQKVLQTLHLAEMAGINASFMTTRNIRIFNKYRKLYDSRIQTICQAVMQDDDLLADINKAIDNGVTTLYLQGGVSDRYVRDGKIDRIAKAIEHIKKQGFFAGVGAHSLEVIKACEREGIEADYYVKTFHHDQYWSAHPRENRVEFSVDIKKYLDHNMVHDNIYDLFPEKTIEFMKEIRKPWIAFKVLAAGAIAPKEGFRFAFENGADFVCVGMFDFQIVEDVNAVNEVLKSLRERERGWYS